MKDFLTSGSITTGVKHRDQATLVVRARVVFTSNDPPNDKDEAVLRRLKVFYFDKATARVDMYADSGKDAGQAAVYCNNAFMDRRSSSLML